jgi:hypothetical protein
LKDTGAGAAHRLPRSFRRGNFLIDTLLILGNRNLEQDPQIGELKLIIFG